MEKNSQNIWNLNNVLQDDSKKSEGKWESILVWMKEKNNMPNLWDVLKAAAFYL